jgi:hypothetical protein
VPQARNGQIQALLLREPVLSLTDRGRVGVSDKSAKELRFVVITHDADAPVAVAELGHEETGDQLRALGQRRNLQVTEDLLGRDVLALLLSGHSPHASAAAPYRSRNRALINRSGRRLAAEGRTITSASLGALSYLHLRNRIDGGADRGPREAFLVEVNQGLRQGE